MVFISVFRAIFNCRSPQAGIIKLEWRVEAIFWKNPEERSEFTLPEPLNNYASKHGGPIVKLFLRRSVDGFSHLRRHFRQVLTSKISSEHRNLSVGVGGSTLIKNLWIKDGQNSMPPKWLNYPEFLSAPNKATTNARNLFHLYGCRSANCGWKIVRCKSAQSVCNKNYCDCKRFVSETFFQRKKRRQNSLFSPMFPDVENRHFSFCYRRNYRIPPKSSFPVGLWDVEISGNYQWRQSLPYWCPASWFLIVAFFESYRSCGTDFYCCGRQRVNQ